MGTTTTLNDNGAWSWFMDPRAIVHRGKLIVGSIRSTAEEYHAGKHLAHWGHCELAILDLETARVERVMFHPHFEQDDHNGPAFHVRPDGRILAIYTKHSQERKIYYRISEPDDPLSWGPIQELGTPGVDHPPYGGDNATYSNPFFLPATGLVYNFHRSVGHQQSYLVSSDQGESWRYGGMFLCGYSGYAPYFKYASNGVDTIHFVGTEDHPRKFDNSVYHGFVRDGRIFQSNGEPFGALSDRAAKSGDIWDLTPVFRGDADHVAWVIDLKLDAAQRPVCLFSVQRDGRGLPRGQGGFDHRFHYARWDGQQWRQHEIAYAGSRLYAGEDDYTGLAAIDPYDVQSIYLSTNVDPVSGTPLVSTADGKQHHELFHGRTADGGEHWTFTAITQNSSGDNLRPIVAAGPRMEPVPLVWMRGTYLGNRGPWDTAVLAALLKRA